MVTTTVGVIRESDPHENRVSLTPEITTKLTSQSITVLVEHGAGAQALIPDSEYEAAGASIVTRTDLFSRCDVVTCINAPNEESRTLMREQQILIGLLQPQQDAELVTQLCQRKVSAISLDLLPRQLSRAQSMDALSSQANIAGYKAVLVAANSYGRYFPMLTTAAGTSTPARVLVLGTGVAGLSAIGTARRLGAIVTAYDVRPQARGEVESLGAKFLKLSSVDSAEGSGGYARALTQQEKQAQQQELSDHISKFDIVITTAKVPGGPPPQLVTEAALDAMQPGSVVVDMAAGPWGGNVALSKANETVTVSDNVTVIGNDNLASDMAPAASHTYARNIAAMLRHVLADGEPSIDTTDDITSATLVTHDGATVSPAVTVADDASAVVTSEGPAS